VTIPISLKDYSEYKSSVINRVDAIYTDKPDEFESELKAFNLLVAQFFANTASEEYLTISDGAYDQGIDFYVVSDNSIQVFQCKFATFEKINNNEQPLAFDDECIKDLKNAYEYLMSDKTVLTANRKVKLLRSEILLKDFESFEFNICIFGHLTKDASDKFEKLKGELATEKISFNLFNWSKVISEIILQEKAFKTNKYKFRIKENQILAQNDYCYFLAHASDIYTAFMEFGWGLFDLNVRSELHNSPINKEIVNSLSKIKSMKYFHHLNNGILIYCHSYTLKPKDNPTHIQVNNFQIINGCQTVRSIENAFSKKIVNDVEKATVFKENCFVQVKILRENPGHKKLLDQVIISSNNQNPMTKRNLKSNTVEQRKIKASFDELKPKWFYQRKDGEFLSYKKLPVIGKFKFRISYYTTNKTYRCIDNQDLAKAWISFIGFSHRAMMTSDYFKEEDLYNKIFKCYPNDILRKDFLQTKKDLIDNGSYFDRDKRPKAEEYLLSYLIWKFIREYSVSPKANKVAGLLRGIEKGTLKNNKEGNMLSTKEEQAQYLANDIDYMTNNIINNSKEVLVSMFSFVLAHKYGFGFKIAKALLNTPTFLPLLKEPNFKVYARDITQKSDNILFSLYEFLRFVITQLYVEIKGEYAAASRTKSYLSNQAYALKLKTKIIEMNSADYLKTYLADWKQPGKSFFDSMPDL